MTVSEQNKKIALLRKDFEALTLRVNELEKAHNRLAHFVGFAFDATTIDRDTGATNKMHDTSKDLKVDTVASRKAMVT